MKVISTESFTNVVPLVLQGNSYVNIHGRLRQKLSPEESEMFATIQMENNGAKWLVADNIPLKSYSEADPSEKEEIAIFIEEKKNIILGKLSSEMNYLPKLFQVPSEKEIFWYRGIDNRVHVILAQWGFVLKHKIKDVNVIDFILVQPRPLTQVEVTLHVDYSDGLPASKSSFQLSLLNHTKEITTNDDGDFYVGNLYAGKTFSITDANGEKREFVVEKDVQRYTATFDVRTSYTVKVLNQEDEPKKNFTININGKSYTTNDEGIVTEENILLTPEMSIEVGSAEAPKCNFKINRDPKDNDFVYRIDDPITAYTIKVMNQNDGLKPYFPLIVNGTELTTDAEGSIKSEEMLFVPGSKLSVSLPDKSNLQEYDLSVERDKNDFIYRIEEKEEPKPEPVTRIRILGYDGIPLPDLTVNVDTKSGKKLSSKTDQDGYVTFLSSNFADGEKPKVHFIISKEYQKSHPLNTKKNGKKD